MPRSEERHASLETLIRRNLFVWITLPMELRQPRHRNCSSAEMIVVATASPASSGFRCKPLLETNHDRDLSATV